jgi:chemotaxis protein histidine kinase CheA
VLPRMSLLLTCSMLLGAVAAPQVHANESASKPSDAGHSPLRLAQADDSVSSKSAFDSAKELGTADAWNAFLANFPTGFHADLARAYLKKIESAKSAPPPAQSAPVANTSTDATRIEATSATGNTHEIHCREQQKVRSRRSKKAAAVTFKNRSGSHRAILWIDFKGIIKDYAALNSGEDFKVDTYVSHPWLITDGPGNCIHIFMPGSGPSEVVLGPSDGSEALNSGEEESAEEARRAREAERAAERRAKKRAAARAKARADERRRKAKREAERRAQREAQRKKKARRINCPAGKVWNGTNCASNPYLDNKGRPQDGYYTDQYGNVYQDNAGGE